MSRYNEAAIMARWERAYLTPPEPREPEDDEYEEEEERDE